MPDNSTNSNLTSAPAYEVIVRDLAFHQSNTLNFLLDFTGGQNQPAAFEPFNDLVVKIHIIKPACQTPVLVKEFFSDKVRSPKMSYDIELNNLPSDSGANPTFQVSVECYNGDDVFSN